MDVFFLSFLNPYPKFILHPASSFLIFDFISTLEINENRSENSFHIEKRGEFFITQHLQMSYGFMIVIILTLENCIPNIPSLSTIEEFIQALLSMICYGHDMHIDYEFFITICCPYELD